MAKSSTRFRNRKINFKTRITVRVGSSSFDLSDDGQDGEVEFEEEKSGSAGGAATVDTGVDKEEEGEIHLQAALAASVSSRTTSSFSSSLGHGTRSHPSSTSPAKPPPVKAFIPTPGAKGVVDDETYRSLYPANVWVDPVTYVRFSDTVEDAQIGAVEYTMDEDDEEWLEEYNATAPTTAAAVIENGKPLDPVPNGTTTPGRSGRDRKGKGEKGKGVTGAAGVVAEEKKAEAGVGPIGEDDFELIMEVFERVTEEKAPMAHVDVELLPTMTDFEPTFADRTVKPPLEHLRFFARAVYPHWKARRLKRGGKSILPQLDYDESNESNPYVCFRRRELKTSRKTRRSDQQNLDRLVRLRNDLFAAHALMLKTRDRERLKLEAIETERKIFEGRVEIRELKRRLGEADGDEDILIGRREKRRRKEDAPAAGGMRVQLRKPDSAFSAASLITSVEDLRARKERAATINARMERDLNRKREADQMWEDWTDGAFLTRQPAHPARYWRAVEAVSGPTGRTDTLSFASQHQQSASGPVRPSFRRRIGRGGRVMLDRIGPHRAGSRPPFPSAASDESDPDSDEDPNVVARRLERFRYDSDVNSDFPSADAPSIIDDFELQYMVKRAGLLRQTDVEFLAPDNSYIEEAYRWVSQEPERPVPPVVYGRPPPRPPMQVQPGGPGGVPMQPPQGGTPQAHAYGQMQMMAAASQAHRMAAQQAQFKRQQAVNGAPPDPRKPPSLNGSPQGPLPMQLPMSQMPMPMNGAPVQAQFALPQGFPTHLQQQQQQQQLVQQQQQQQQQQQHHQQLRLPPNGANGLPATSRLSAPPFSNPQQAMQLAQQQQLVQQQQLAQQQLAQQQHSSPSGMQRPPSASSDHRQQQVPSRPPSAASSHLSPSLSAQSLPMSPGGLHGVVPNGKRSSPSLQHPNFPPGLQAGTTPQGMKAMSMQSLPYGGFVGAQT